MKKLFLLAVLLVPLTIAAAPVPKAKEKDPKAILGKWKVISMERGGEIAPDGTDELKIRIEFGKEEITLHHPRQDPQKASYKLDPAKMPKQIDIRPKVGTEKVLGIYTLKGDDLQIAYVEGEAKRPARFETTKDTKETLIKLKRVKE